MKTRVMPDASFFSGAIVAQFNPQLRLGIKLLRNALLSANLVRHLHSVVPQMHPWQSAANRGRKRPRRIRLARCRFQPFLKDRLRFNDNLNPLQIAAFRREMQWD